VAAAVSTTVSEIAVAGEPIRPQAPVRRPETAQQNAGSFPTISIEEDHALTLNRNPDGGQGSLGRMCPPRLQPA
jgi:hypothetical protein